jgi:hypothetical protein
MTFLKTVALSFVTLGGLLAMMAASQKKSAPPSMRIEKDKPTVYISFVRVAKREPLHEGESKEGVWLKLHNNTRWTLVHAAFGVEPKWGEVGLFYDVELAKRRNRSDLSELPLGYDRGDVSSTNNLPSGKSILFSVPREHLAKNLRLRICYNYSWEAGDRGWVGYDEPEHCVFFYGSNVPEPAK